MHYGNMASRRRQWDALAQVFLRLIISSTVFDCCRPDKTLQGNGLFHNTPATLQKLLSSVWGSRQTVQIVELASKVPKSQSTSQLTGPNGSAAWCQIPLNTFRRSCRVHVSTGQRCSGASGGSQHLKHVFLYLNELCSDEPNMTASCTKGEKVLYCPSLYVQ